MKKTNLSNLHGQEPKYGSVYTKLSKYRTIFLNENVSKENSATISSLLLYYDNKDQESDIFLYLNTNGGDSSGLMHIYDTIQMIKSPVSTICAGKCYSAGAFILACGTKGKRYAMKHSNIMIHGLQCKFPLEIDMDLTGSGNYFDYLTKYNDSVLKILAKHTNKEFSQVKEDCRRDFYLSAEEAKKYGIIDKII